MNKQSDLGTPKHRPSTPSPTKPLNPKPKPKKQDLVDKPDLTPTTLDLTVTLCEMMESQAWPGPSAMAGFFWARHVRTG